MPDLRIITSQEANITDIGFKKVNDTVVGAMALGQAAVLMLLDPRYGNISALLKDRIDADEINEVVFRAIDTVERALLDEQAGMVLPEDEILVALEVVSIEISPGQVDVSLSVENKFGETTIVSV